MAVAEKLSESPSGSVAAKGTVTVAWVDGIVRSAIGCNTGGWLVPVAVTVAENSEVLLPGSVAVAVITSPALVMAGSKASKLALPPVLVVTLAEPR